MANAKQKTLRFLSRHTLWLSLLFHFLFLTSFSFVWFFPVSPDNTEKPPQYIPSYTYQQPAQPAPEQDKMIAEKKVEPQKQTAKNGLEKPVVQKPSQTQLAKQSSRPSPKHKPEPVSISDPNNTEPMHLVGETKIVKPLVKILASALSQHLFYPRSAAEFGLTGTVLVGFTLHPEGFVTDTKIVKSSGTGVLDDAAQAAVNSISPLSNVSDYVQKPEYLVVGIIFG